RHTRFSRDWSSDVCSSDLPGIDHTLGHSGAQGQELLRAADAAAHLVAAETPLCAVSRIEARVALQLDLRRGRVVAERLEHRPHGSEVRRVGKGRSWKGVTS